jgi:hypothetical protein
MAHLAFQDNRELQDKPVNQDHQGDLVILVPRDPREAQEARDNLVLPARPDKWAVQVFPDKTEAEDRLDHKDLKEMLEIGVPKVPRDLLGV